ncbi:DUF342 domain-containing protein [Candidatus Kryptobacter tengchongensis]|uniref:Flagellar Assembly Protein A N-terminal region domain-containing protein n=1 Tax=Kryptobacter tengchongensis TaxID=1643429 RepID=A0A916PAY6_KRYT1|nr:FapA family protein [Candidatus Kryptobacter tengchongensis]CUS97281.1 hypothetical protein JGI25_00237 [Candidatus Kryptobacter tengchongensis]
MKVKITPDKLRAYLVVESKDELNNLCIDDVVKFINSKGVVQGIKIIEIQSLLENPQEGEFLIAEGNPPIDGRDGYISFEFDITKKTLIRNVKAGEKIAVVYPPTSGVNGIGVTGEILKAKQGKPANVFLGQNVAFLDSDNSVIVSTSDGNLVLNEDGTIEVSPVLKINGNIDVSFGEVNFIGTLIVNGDIKSGAKVKVGKNLEVYGNIEDAEVEVKGNALIGGGFIGYGRGRLYVHGDVSLRYITNQNLIADGDVVIKREAVNANIVCGGKIIAKDAVIIGGTVMCKGEVEAKSIGGAEYSRTVIIIGRRDKQIEKLKKVTAEIKRLGSYLEGIKSEIYALARLKIDWGELPEDQERQLQNLMKWRDEIPKRLQQLEVLRENLLNDVKKSGKARLIVYGTIYKNTYIEINGAREEINFDMKNSIFEEDMGIVVRSKLQEV